MNKVIITGATSMLGLALVDECIKNGTEVYAVVRPNTVRLSRLPDSPLIHVLHCDLENISSLAPGETGFDAFYHYAWACTENQSRNLVDAQNRNIDYTLDAVRVAHSMGCKKFIGAGSQAEYGRVSGVITPDMRVFPDSAYGIAKYAAGRLAGILCEQLGMPFIWTRIFSTYGVRDMPSTMIMYVIGCLLRGEKPSLTPCQQKWDYLNCRDAATAFYLIGLKGNPGSIYHIGSGQARPLEEYVLQIRDAVNPSLELGIGEREYAPKQVMHLCADISNLCADTGFSPSISFPEGIRETIEWCREREGQC